MHIQTDMIIDDREEKAYHNRRDKYFGHNSMLKLIHKEGVRKIQDQRAKFKSTLKIPKYPTNNKTLTNE